MAYIRLVLRRKLYLAVTLLLLLALPACGQTTDNAYALMLKGMYQYTVPQLTPEKLKRAMQQPDGKPLLLDTRTKAEYEVSHIAGATFVGYDDFEVSQLKHIPRDAPIIVYCSVGYRSERVGERLQEAGYRNVQNLYGGIFEWVNQGHPIYNRQGKTDKVHAYSKMWSVWLQKGEKVYE